MIRVLLADDSPLVRSILRSVLESDPEIRVVAEASNGREAVDGAVRLKPDILLMDVRMPVMDGIEATEEIMATAAVPILIVSGAVNEDTNTAFRAIQGNRPSRAKVASNPGERMPPRESSRASCVPALT